MNGIVHEIETRARMGPRAINALLEGRKFPVVEGRTVTFVFRGHVDEVRLRHWIHGLPQAQPFHHIAGTDLWFLAVDVPDGSRMEYKLEVVDGQEHRLIQDPLNDQVALDPYGVNSVVYTSGYVVPDWTLPDPEARPGELVEQEVDARAFGDKRRIQVYLPARFRPSRSYPLLIVHDGEDYVRYASLKTVLDNLIHRLEIPSMIVALIPSQDRLNEYADDRRHAKFLVEDLLPHLEKSFPLVDKPSARGLMGASFGAVASLAAAWRYQGVFGNLLLQSGSFAFTDIGKHDRGPVFDPVVRFVNAFRKQPGHPADHLFISCGVYESLIYFNRSLVPFLQKSGLDVRYVEANDGHNWENWRDRLREGLSWLYPGPLWMVYE
jgi:enterochelin esterase family protein